MRLEFYFDVGSPTAYLAHCRLLQLRQRYTFALTYRPMLLGGVFKAAGSASPATVAAKGRYMLEHDLPRFAARYGVPLNANPHFPINTLSLMRTALAARHLGCLEACVLAMFRAIWVDSEAMGDAQVAARKLAAAGLDAAALTAKSLEGAIKQELIEATQAAVERGVFGAPTMFLGEAMFFGQDRLDFVEERLAARGAAPSPATMRS